MPRGNYQFVVDSSFRPFEFQELMQPWAVYKDAFEKQEAALDELTRNTDTFKYLEQVANDNPDSEAAKIYMNYADELKRQGADFSANGLSMANRRGLLNLKRRYQGEIGLLDAASKAMDEERKLRRANKDTSMLYAEDNLNIDQFLYGKNPNLYGISGNELYTRGAAAGKAASSRVYSAGDEGSTLNGYYRKWVERYGYSKESMDAFRANVSAIPELQQAALDIMKERGVDTNLKGNNYNRAYQSIINGIIDGAISQESAKPIRDEGRMSAAQAASNALGWANHNESVRQHNLQMKMNGYDPETGEYDPTKDQSVRKAAAIAAAKGSGSGGNNGTKDKTTRDGLLEKPVRITFNSSMPERKDGKWADIKIGAAFEEDYTSENIELENVGEGKHYTYEQLPSFVKRKIPKSIDRNKHIYWINEDADTGGAGFLTPNHYTVTIVPMKTTISKETNTGAMPSVETTEENFGFE